DAGGRRPFPASPRSGTGEPADQAVRGSDPAMRARLPDRAGVVQRDGVRVAFEVFGHGEPALLLMPASPITHARSWKGIVPSLARRFTVVTTDGRGTGRSDRPRTPECYAPAEVTADLLAVLDAASVDLAFLVAHCHAVPWALCLAADHPERVAGLLAIDPAVAVAPRPAAEAEAPGRRVRCPVRVVHGSDDRGQPLARGRRLAELTGGDLVVLEGAGHLPQGRDPVKVTRLITGFVDRTTGASMHGT